jgi:hypothetical protein
LSRFLRCGHRRSGRPSEVTGFVVQLMIPIDAFSAWAMMCIAIDVKLRSKETAAVIEPFIAVFAFFHAANPNRIHIVSNRCELGSRVPFCLEILVPCLAHAHAFENHSSTQKRPNVNNNVLL